MLFTISFLVAGHTKPSDSQIMLTELIKFFVEVKIHDHASYFVDSFWEYTDVLEVSVVVDYHSPAMAC